MQEWIQNILIYVVLVTVLKGLISNQSFGSYFHFFSGVLLILLLITPITAWLGDEQDWYLRLQKNIFQMDLAQVEEQLSIADGSFTKVVEEEYKQELANQILALAGQQKEGVRAVQITLYSSDLKESHEKIAENSFKIKMISVEVEDWTRKDRKKLGEQIGQYYSLKEEQVEVWNGVG